MTTDRYRLLFVDDEPEILSSLRRTFHKDYEIKTAVGGRAGIAALREYQIDLIICDQRMPDIGGDEVLKAARELHPDAVRILLTGYSDIQALMRCVNDAQISKYIAKPWETEALRRIVADALENLRISRRLKAVPTSPDLFLAQCEKEHALINELGTDLLAAFSEKYRRPLLDRVLRFYTMYFKFHFDGEERYMVSIRYPGYEPHREMHARFIRELELLKERFDRNEDVYASVKDLYLSLVDGHIPATDAELTKYIKDNCYPPASWSTS